MCQWIYVTERSQEMIRHDRMIWTHERQLLFSSSDWHKTVFTLDLRKESTCMVVGHTINPRILEAEAVSSLSSRLACFTNNFHNSQNYTNKPCLEKKERKKKWRKLVRNEGGERKERMKEERKMRKRRRDGSREGDWEPGREERKEVKAEGLHWYGLLVLCQNMIPWPCSGEKGCRTWITQIGMHIIWINKQIYLIIIFANLYLT